MNLLCVCKHVSYAAWRFDFLRTLCRSSDELHFRNNLSRRERSRPQILTRNYNYVPWGSRANQGSQGEDAALGRPSATADLAKADTGKEKPFNPYNAAGRQAIKDLLLRLKGVSRKVAENGEKVISGTKHQSLEQHSAVDPNATSRSWKVRSVPGKIIDFAGREGHHSVQEVVPELMEVDQGMTPLDDTSSAVREVAQTPVSPVLLWVEKAAKRREPRKIRPLYHQLRGLKNNSWAEILASPVRACQASGARLPTDLLLDFSFVKSPQGNGTYLMPANLADLETLEAKLAAELAESKRLPVFSDGMTVRPQQDGTAHESDSEGSANDPRPPTKPYFRSQSRVLSNLTFFHFLSNTVTQPTRESSKFPSPTTREAISSEVAKLIHFKAREAVGIAQHYSHNKQRFETAGSAHVGEPASASASAAQNSVQFNLNKLDWQQDVPVRIAHIMRKRILVALKALLQAESVAEEQTLAELPPAVIFLSIPESGAFKGDELRRTGSVAERQRPSSTPESSSPGFTTGADRGDARRKQDHAQTSPSTSSASPQPTYQDLGHVEWSPGSIFLHTGPGDIPSLLASRPAQQSTLPPLPDSNPLIPPMISVMDTYRFPAFSVLRLFAHAGSAAKAEDLEALKNLLSPYMEILRSPQPDVGGTERNEEAQDDHLLFIRSTQGPARIFIEEVWRLWRYLGGENMDVAFFSEDEDLTMAEAEAGDDR